MKPRILVARAIFPEVIDKLQQQLSSEQAARVEATSNLNAALAKIAAAQAALK